MSSSHPDIIVSTSTDFAVSRGGRPVAAARWEDVVRVRAYKRGDAVVAPICLDVELAGGPVVSVDDDSPGWDDFLSDLEAQLPDARPSHSWIADLDQPAGVREKVPVFERRAGR